MRIRLLGIILLFLVCSSHSGNAQDIDTFPQLVPSYINYFYNEDIPYSKKCFKNIFQDGKGRLWLTPCGVETLINSIGLYQFDGYKFDPFEVVSTGNKVLESPNIQGVYEGNRFLGLVEERKPFLIDIDTRQAKLLEPADTVFKDCIVRGVSVKQETTHVLASKGEDQMALFLLKNGVLELEHLFDTPSGFWQGGSYEMVVSEEEIWLINRTLPVYRFDRKEKSFQTFHSQAFLGHPLSPPRKGQYHTGIQPKVIQSANGDVYLYLLDSAGKLLFRFDREKGRFLSMKQGFPDDWQFVDFFHDDAGHICFLFEDDAGLYKAVLETRDGRRFDYSAVVEGRKQIMEIAGGNFLEQVFILTQEGFYGIGIRNQEMVRQVLTDQWISSMASLPDGRLLVNTVNNGWFVYDEKKGNTTIFQGVDCATEPPAFNKGMRQQIIPDTSGNLWFVSYQYLVKFQPQIKECYAYELESKSSLFQLVDEGLAIYQSARDKLSFLDLDSGKTVSFGPGIPTKLGGFVRDIMVDSKGIIWVPTNNGLWKIDIQKEQSELLGLEQGFLDFRFTAIFEGADGKIWLGTYFGGLYRYDPATGEVIVIDQDRGLSNNAVMGILIDDDGDLWVSTEYGINIISPEGEVLNSIYKEDGLSHETFERFDPYKGPDGLLYFGSRKGISIIDPTVMKAYLEKEATVQAYLTELRYFDKEIGKEVIQKENLDGLGKINISAERPYLNLKFGLSSYLEPDKNNYAYMLEGKDKDWHYLGTQPELNIGWLPPGKYRLLIKGADFRNNWSEEPIAIDIHARQFFYKQAWFYILLGLPFLAFALLWARNKQLEADRLEKEVALRTQKIREDKTLIEKQAAELRQLDTLKSRFFTNISHELRTPITLIKAPLENFLQKYSTSLNEGMRHSLKLVLSNAGKLGNLVEELLELSSLEAKKATLKETTTPLTLFCRQLFSAYESGAALKDIHYHFDTQLEEDAHFLVDRKRLEKIINNLLSNALKFTPQGGSVHMNLRREEDQLLIQVKDSGRGVPPEDLPHLFDRYFQTRREEIATEGGTGIGLALSKELASLMNGDLRLESEWGKGACFTLLFPAKEALSQATDPVEMVSENPSVEPSIPLVSHTAAAAKNGSKPKLLIVEDNPDMQQLIRTLLVDTYDCIVANNGLEAWTWLEKGDQNIKDIELIVSDVMMPKMDGYTLLEKIKAHERWQNLPVIMLTARSAEEDKLQALRMGVDDYLLKPFSPAELKARLKNLITNYQIRKELSNGIGQPTQKINVEFDSDVVSANQTWLKEVEDAAKEALELGIKLNTILLAEKVFLSERQFSRTLKKLTGLTPNEYIQEIKLQKARHLFENQVYTTISEVAQAAGYSSGSYLSKIYQERFGKKPTDYF